MIYKLNRKHVCPDTPRILKIKDALSVSRRHDCRSTQLKTMYRCSAYITKAGRCAQPIQWP